MVVDCLIDNQMHLQRVHVTLPMYAAVYQVMRQPVTSTDSGILDLLVSSPLTTIVSTI